MNIREATDKDLDEIWPIFHEIVSAGETYAYPRNTTKEQALDIWINSPKKHMSLKKMGIFLVLTI